MSDVVHALKTIPSANVRSRKRKRRIIKRRERIKRDGKGKMRRNVILLAFSTFMSTIGTVVVQKGRH